MKKVKRDKALLGAVIGSVAGVAGSLIGASAAKREQERQQEAANRKALLDKANAMTQAYANQDYVDDLKDRITFKNGGKMKKGLYGDRLKAAKKFKCGGRKKAKWGANDTNAVIGGIGNLASSIIGSSVNTSVDAGDGFSANQKSDIKIPDYVMNNENRMRCGGKKRRR